MRSVVRVPEVRLLLLERLAAMSRFLEEKFAALTPPEAAERLADGEFAPVEQCWHLADLEREGYAVRIRRLLEEDEPELPDFDGARVAAERNYRSLDLVAGLAAFRAARAANVAALRRVPDAAWTRGGTQEGVGRITLCDVPAMMDGHDAAHRAEILEWVRARVGR
jgi:hypothetical protein